MSARFGPAGPPSSPAIDRLDAISDRGSTGDVYKQNSRNFALFTHNIFHVTDKFDVTLGLRYTHERKEFDADLRQRQHRLPPEPGGARRPS